jgi:colanic acid biosynthesis glycosyl transferase WcaI
MRILLLSQWFQPEPAFKGLPLAKALQDRGHNVEVLTGFPNYPGGRVYPGYRIGLWQREIMDNIRVNRVALYPSHDKSGLRRSINYLSFGLSSAIVGNFLINRPDVVYAFNLVTLGLATNLIKVRFRCPIIYDIQDLWPDSVAYSKMLRSRYLLGLLDRLSIYTYDSSTHLIALSPGMKDKIIRRGVDESRVTVIYNWCDEEHMKPMPRDESLAANYGLNGHFVVMFAGTMGVMQGLDVLLEAAELVMEESPDIRFVLVGGGIEFEPLKRIAASKKLSNVVFIGKQAAEKMAAILGLADVMVVHLKDSPVFEIAIPSKIQAYLAVGKPIIAGIRGDAETIIRESGAGKVVAPEHPRAISDAVLEFFRMPPEERKKMGKRGLEYYKSRMSLKAGVDSIEKIFIRCVDERKGIGRRPAESKQIL